MKTRIVKDKRVGEGFTIMRKSIYWPADRQRQYLYAWFETREQAAKYILDRGWKT